MRAFLFGVFDIMREGSLARWFLIGGTLWKD